MVKRCADGGVVDATPAGANVRSRVHEFGGAPFAVCDGVIYFSELTDQRLYKLMPGGLPKPMTPAGPWRYADPTIDRRRGRLICVREKHPKNPPGDFPAGGGRKILPEVFSALVSVPMDGPPLSAGDVIASGCDFYSSPRFSPDAAQLAWLAWNHPLMPWDGTELWLARVGPGGHIEQAHVVAGGAHEAIFQPGWSPDGVLHFVSDRSGWWNVYRLRGSSIEAVSPVDADCGRPQWTFGAATWAFCGRRLIQAQARKGRWALNVEAARNWEPAEFLAANDRHVVFAGGCATSPDVIVRVDAQTDLAEILRTAGPAAEPRDISVAEAIEFPTTNGTVAYAFFYAPAASARGRRPPDESAAQPDDSELRLQRPPLIVMCHGGPTSAAHARLNLEIQFWTSRGFAVIDVNYRGSTGFGRAYRSSLNGLWGVADVEDCVNAARFVVRQGKADGQRLVMRGRSAGGFTVLSALVRFPDMFAAAAVYYGVADLERLAHDTHKFEAHYLDRLVGPYPEAADIYRDRSPLNHVHRLRSPLIVFQGLDDKVVAPGQSRAIAAAARANGVSVEYLEFSGEGHGFRNAETIARCLEAEYNFFSKQIDHPYQRRS